VHDGRGVQLDINACTDAIGQKGAVDSISNECGLCARCDKRRWRGVCCA
jgi:hypothetical protein